MSTASHTLGHRGQHHPGVGVTMGEHTHVCRDCFDEFPCDGLEDWRGCPEFEGSCPGCREAEEIAHLMEESPTEVSTETRAWHALLGY